MLIPVVIVAASLLGLAFVHAKKAPHGRILSALDSHMPPKLRTLVAQSVQKGTNPAQLATLAKKLQPSYPAAAAIVATRVIQIVPPKPKPSKGLAIAPSGKPRAVPIDPLHLVSDGTSSLTDVANALHQVDLTSDARDDRAAPKEYE